MEAFTEYILALIFLFLISIAVNLLSKKLKIPYTILLVLMGILLIPLSNLEYFNFLKSFELTPEILFFIFLPILIFESGYNIKYLEFKKDWPYIFGLAIGGLLISTFVISFGMYYILNLVGYHIPFEFCLLFGALISATDPVAVLSLFKEIGAPKRLALLFEGESLFNDGTSLAVFLIVLEAVKSGVFSTGSLIKGVISFLFMFFGGIFFGLLMGALFAKILSLIKDNEHVEITITMIMATLTFLLAELISDHLVIFGFDIKISAIIATAISAIVMGNYGVTKISPKVERYMNKFWSFFSFLVNSLIFLSLGLLLSKININIFDFLGPILLTILVIIIARAISVYIPINFINFFKKDDKVPLSRQHLLAWGSLRGALALMMALMIPDNLTLPGWNYPFSVKDAIIVLTIVSIMFSLFVKGLTIKSLISMLGIDRLHLWEKFEKEEASIIVDWSLLKKIEKLYKLGIIRKEEYEELYNKVKYEIDKSLKNINKLLKQIKNPRELLLKIFALHALGIEKKHLNELFEYGEVDEFVYGYLLRKIDVQMDRLENGKSWLKTDEEKMIEKEDIFIKLARWLDGYKDDIIERFLRNRTKLLLTGEVIKEMQKFKEINLGIDNSVIDEVIKVYEKFHEKAKSEIEKLYLENKLLIERLNLILTIKNLTRKKERIIKDLYEKEIISPKIYHKFIEDISLQIHKDIKKIEI